MPKILDFQIKNFKGIESLSLDIGRRARSPVITLVGLNESGKTTILEAISHFVSEDTELSSMFTGIHAKADSSALIPLHKRGNFTDRISIEANFAWEEADINDAFQIFADNGWDLSIDNLKSEFNVERRYTFRDSELKELMNYWILNLHARPSVKGRQKPKPFTPYIRPKEAENDLWLKVVNKLSYRVPKVVYFPTFLVDMPARIYLVSHGDESAVNKYYRTVIQEILTSIDADLSIDTHIVKRILEFKSEQELPQWWSFFLGSSKKRNVDSVIQRLSAAITNKVIGSWSAVFQRPSGAKRVDIELNIDAQKGDAPYISFNVTDGDAVYLVSERSLGFRWFFSFLLFTAFKEGQQRQTIFLFDEPAANLHAKAQAELLKNFGRIATAGNKVIYSTHSHHMIDLRWLSSAYIIENSSIDYDGDDSFELNSKPTNISSVQYRKFISEYPSRTSYFQPVIEKLEYVTPQLIGAPPFILFEGISDFYAFSIIVKKHSRRYRSISLIPGSGAGSSAPLLSYLIGRGEQFVVVLDDDAAGRRAKTLYTETFFLRENAVATLGDLDPTYVGKRLESLISKETAENIKISISSSSQLSKKEIGAFLAEKFSSEDYSCYSKETEDSMMKVLDEAIKRLL